MDIDQNIFIVIASILASMFTALLTYFSQRSKLKAESRTVAEEADELVFQRLQSELDRRSEQMDKFEEKIEGLQEKVEKERRARLNLLDEERKRTESLTNQLLAEKNKSDELASRLERERNLRHNLNSEIENLKARVGALENENAVLRSLFANGKDKKG